MFQTGDIIDGKYRVDGICSDTGGMGRILFVTPLLGRLEFNVVLKYCRESDQEQIKRFRREVRLLASFKGNSKIVQIVDENLNHAPPYFVMKHYQQGDLGTLSATLKASLEVQEHYFMQMIDCVNELHARAEFHRDVKPQNFLLEGDQVVVSDFGLTTEIGSDTAFTSSSAHWGTQGYIPPEFFNGGFKHADATGDIFMLGKTFYVLVTNREPTYLVEDEVPSPIFHIIQRCCSIPKSSRYQTLAELKQSLAAAYDVLLGRAGGVGKVRQLLSGIQDRIGRDFSYDSAELAAFIEQLAFLDSNDQIHVCADLSREFFRVLRQGLLADRICGFLGIYEKLVEGRDYTWSYSETIAQNMEALFDGETLLMDDRAHALDLAIRAADYMNRYAAMDTCRSMIKSVRDEAFGIRIASVLLKHRSTFVAGVEVSECQSESIRNALRQIKQQ